MFGTKSRNSVTPSDGGSVVTATNHEMLKPSQALHHHDQEQFNIFLFFANPRDEKLYKRSLKDLFYYPTFMPFLVILVVMLILPTHSNSKPPEDAFTGPALAVIMHVLSIVNYVLLFSFIAAQSIRYWRAYLPEEFQAFHRFVVEKFLYGHVEDTAVILNAVIGGLDFFIVTMGNRCAQCNKIYATESCDNSDADSKNFPLHVVFYVCAQQLVLPFFLKYVHRQVAVTGMLIIAICAITAYVAGGYSFDSYLIFTILFFLISMYEFERFKMMSFLLSRAALNAQQNQLSKSQLEAKEKIERKMNSALLQQILPQKVAEQILLGKPVDPESFDEVTIFFSDVVGFTNICAAVKPIQVVKMLNDLYTVMDYCTSLFPLYKVETIGDAYMVVGGLPTRDPHHAEQVADFAILVSRAVQAVLSPADGTPIRIRIGLHSGPVMAGVVGNLMPRYCLFGDTVNTASRMESNGEAGRIHCSEFVTRILMATNKFQVDKRGDIPIKGKGIMTTYWLEKALESNSNSNDLAVAKTEVMCHELLGLNAEDDEEEDDDDYLSEEGEEEEGSVGGDIIEVSEFIVSGSGRNEEGNKSRNGSKRRSAKRGSLKRSSFERGSQKRRSSKYLISVPDDESVNNASFTPARSKKARGSLESKVPDSPQRKGDAALAAALKKATSAAGPGGGSPRGGVASDSSLSKQQQGQEPQTHRSSGGEPALAIDAEAANDGSSNANKASSRNSEASSRNAQASGRSSAQNSPRSPRLQGAATAALASARLRKEGTSSPKSMSPRSPRRGSTSSSNSFYRKSQATINPNALHSIHFNMTHGLNSPDSVIDTSGAKILIVEDSPTQRKMLVLRLQKADPTWDIKQASSGEEALAKLKAARFRFDVVFVDETLSDNDGLYGHELVQIMREQYNMNACVIIACTSNPAKAGNDLIQAGVDYVWPKPPPAGGVLKTKIDSLINERIKRISAATDAAAVAAASTTSAGAATGSSSTHSTGESGSGQQ